jgi:hypothetical protein
MAKLEIDINKLSPDERLDLIEELWAKSPRLAASRARSETVALCHSFRP